MAAMRVGHPQRGGGIAANQALRRFAAPDPYIPFFGALDARQAKLSVLFVFVLTLSVFISISLLFFWHVYLVATAQTTIDFYGNRLKKREAKAEGRVWVNEHDLGWRRNWQATFDERGRFWWLMWASPRIRPHSGDGCSFETLYSMGQPFPASFHARR